MEKIANQKAFNETFVDQIEENNIKDATVSAQSFTRNKLREDSFAEKIITPIDIANDELDKSQDPEILVKWNDREPDSPGAVTVPYGVVPSATQFTGTRYPSYFARIVTEKHSKDIDKLRGFTYDIRGVLMEQDVKNLATEIDTRFINTCEAYIGSENTVNPLNGLGLPQYQQFAGGITRENVVEAFKGIKRLQVPFGPGQTDGGEQKGVMLMNNITYDDFLKLGPSEVGWDTAQDSWTQGLNQKTVLGVKAVTTIKSQLIPDGQIWLFTSEEFFGKYYRLHPLQVFMKTEAYLLEWFSYINLSLSIGNFKGMFLADFTG